MAGVARPPGPWNPPIAGHLRAFIRDPADFLYRLGQQYGDAATYRMGRQNIFFFNHPDLIKEVLVTQQAAFHKSRVLQKSKALLGEGLLTSEDDFHLRQRRLVQPAFHRERLAGYAKAMLELGEAASTRWQDGAVVDMHREMTRITLGVVARTLFSTDVDEDSDRIGEAMTAVLGLFEVALLPFSEVLQKLPLPMSIRFRKAKQQLDDVVYRIIADRRASGADTGDLLSMLILARDEEGGTGGMTDQQVRDEALTLFLAGHETTAVALVWTWYLLSQNPDVEARFHAEIDGITPGFDTLPQLEYTRAVLAESMRLYPPAWGIGRMATRDIEIGGYPIPKGDIVLVSPFATHRDGRFWEAPLEFRPERFLGDTSGRHKFVYFPFGGGARVCIGERFAWMEGTLLLAVLGRRWRARLEQTSVEHQAQITLRPRGGLRMKISRRE